VTCSPTALDRDDARQPAAAIVRFDGLRSHLRAAPHRARPHTAGQRDLRHDPPETVEARRAGQGQHPAGERSPSPLPHITDEWHLAADRFALARGSPALTRAGARQPSAASPKAHRRQIPNSARTSPSHPAQRGPARHPPPRPKSHPNQRVTGTTAREKRPRPAEWSRVALRAVRKCAKDIGVERLCFDASGDHMMLRIEPPSTPQTDEAT
jgi:hypothetical protein